MPFGIFFGVLWMLSLWSGQATGVLATQPIVEGPSPRCNLNVVILPTDTVTCRFPRPVLTAVGDPQFEYQWLNEDGFALGTGLSLPLVVGGNYRLVVHDPATGCRDTLATDVAEDQRLPLFDFSPHQNFTCQRDEVEVTAIIPDFDNDSLRIEWRTLGGTLIGDLPTHTITDGQPYVAVMRNTTNSCGSRDTVQIGFDTLAPTPLINAPTELVINCQFPSLRFSVSGSLDYQYRWNDATGNQLSDSSSLVVAIAGLISLQTTDQSNQCSSQQTFVIEAQGEAPEIDYEVSFPNCAANAMATLQINSITGSSDNYSLLLNGQPINSEETVVLAAGTEHHLRARDEHGCETVQYIDIPAYEPITAEIIVNQESYLVGDSMIAQLRLSSSGLIATDWYVNGRLVESSGGIFSSLATEDFLLEVYLTDAFGCEFTYHRAISVVSGEATLFIPTAFSPNFDGVNDRLLIGTGSSIRSLDYLRCYDRWGSLLFLGSGTDVVTSGWDGYAGNQPVAAGVYLVQVDYTLVNGKKGTKSQLVNLVR